MADFCRKMSILLSREKEDVDSAIINKGPYCLASEFATFDSGPGRSNDMGRQTIFVMTHV